MACLKVGKFFQRCDLVIFTTLLQRHFYNVVTTSEKDVVITSEKDVVTTSEKDVGKLSETTYTQRCSNVRKRHCSNVRKRRCNNVFFSQRLFMSLSQRCYNVINATNLQRQVNDVVTTLSDVTT